MPIQAKEENGALTVFLSGDIDHASARSMMLALDKEVARRAPGLLRVDMSGVTFMDSSGIAVLLRTWRRVRRPTPPWRSPPSPASPGRYLPPRDYLRSFP